jgi:hypothetical protein
MRTGVLNKACCHPLAVSLSKVVRAIGLPAGDQSVPVCGPAFSGDR